MYLILCMLAFVDEAKPAPKLTEAQQGEYWRALAIYQTKKLETIQAEQNLNKEFEKIKRICSEVIEDSKGPQCAPPKLKDEKK